MHFKRFITAILASSFQYAMAQSNNAASASTSAVLINPNTRYNNNYTLPDQGFPGLDSNWHPPHDDGETSYVGHGRLRGRRALITGGDSGIGRAVAIAYAREGADVAIAYLPQEQSDATVTVNLVRAAGQRIFTFTGDLRNETYCAELVRNAASELGGLDILVSHAGYVRNSEHIADLHTADMLRTFETNVYAGLWLTRAAAPILPPGSSIIFTSSQLASSPGSTTVDYSASKAAVRAMTKSLALQLGGQGIRVNAVAPGPIYTNFLTTQGLTTPEIHEICATSTVFGRCGQASEMAPLYVSLADEAMSYTTGSVWGAGGGDGEF